MRYEQILAAVRQKQPKVIVEVGTWNGRRAQAMLSLCPDATYYGFDLFEDATVENDREEMNVKPHHYMDNIHQRLDGYKAFLYKGNTRETLKNFNEKVDFVWLDGGHSVETIQSDWDNLKRCLMPDAWVFFDDYYTGPIDTSKFGCNTIVAKLKHEILPQTDPVMGGGQVQIVRVYP
jgi:predicted O-methyltransferase YrrM